MEWTLTETGTAEPGAVLSLAPKAPVQNQVSRTRGTHGQSNGFGYELGYEVKGDFVNLAKSSGCVCYWVFPWHQSKFPACRTTFQKRMKNPASAGFFVFWNGLPHLII